jgi:hypothetical protein
VIGVGAQDDFPYAQDFIYSTGTMAPTMLWDPSFSTWQAFGVTVNSQMMLASADLTETTELFSGFGDEEQQLILDSLPDLVS